jgi:hypothetical protein
MALVPDRVTADSRIGAAGLRYSVGPARAVGGYVAIDRATVLAGRPSAATRYAVEYHVDADAAVDSTPVERVRLHHRPRQPLRPDHHGPRQPDHTGRADHSG